MADHCVGKHENTSNPTPQAGLAGVILDYPGSSYKAPNRADDPRVTHLLPKKLWDLAGKQKLVHPTGHS